MNIDPQVIKKIYPTAQKQQEIANKILEKYRPALVEIHQSLLPAIKQMQKLVKRPEFKFQMCIAKVGTFDHPLFYEMFADGFNEDMLKSNWVTIRRYLWKRKPESLMEDNLEERYNQLLKAQTAKAYIAVCRGAYAEIEGLIRDQILFKDEEFVARYSAKEDKKKRHNFIASKSRDLREGKHDNLWGIDFDAPLHEVGIFTGAFLFQLNKSFESFDPDDARSNQHDLKTNRHFHAHGWSKHAGFMDGLNSLLLLDMAMQLIEETKEAVNV